MANSRRVGRNEISEEPGGELDFERGDDRGGRAGDSRSSEDLREEFPPARVREAGSSGGETVDGHVTADDLSPETLLREAHADGPDGFGGESPADQDLTEVGESGIGAGHGKDEAELAQQDADEWEASGRAGTVSRKDVLEGNQDGLSDSVAINGYGGSRR